MTDTYGSDFLSAFAEFYQQELLPFANAQRDINKAKSAKNLSVINFTSASNFKNTRQLEVGANILGKGLIAIDAGVLVGNVNTDYLDGHNW